MTPQQVIEQFRHWLALDEITEFNKKRMVSLLEKFGKHHNIVVETIKEVEVPKVIYKTKYVPLLEGEYESDSAQPPQATESDLMHLAESVCKNFRVTVEGIKSHRRSAYLVQARRAFVREAKTRYTITYVSLGKFLNRDHSSIVHLMRECTLNVKVYEKILPKKVA